MQGIQEAMNRRTPRLGWLIILTMVCGVSGCARTPLPFDSPPILIVDIDTLRADHLGCYGYSRSTSPNIDAFADEAVRFEWAFAQAPNTPPSQASILTGLYPTTHGRIGNQQKIAEDAPRLAGELSGAGYLTRAFVDGGLMAAGFGYEQGFDAYDDEAGHLLAIGPKVIEYLRARASDSRDGSLKPWFVLVHTYDTHSPYEVSPEPFNSYFHSDLEELPPEDFRGRMSEVMADAWEPQTVSSVQPLSDVELEYAKACYDGGIRHVDDWFGELVRELKRRRLYDSCILVVISDHGEEFQEHGSLFHEKVYSPVARIPLIIRFPNGRHGGVVVEDVVESIDLMPTLLDAVGVAVPPKVQGRTLLPLISGELGRSKFAFTESPYFGRRIAVATNQHRLVYTETTELSELFSYRDDTLEIDDIASSDHALQTELERGIEIWQQMVGDDQASSPQGPEWNAEQLEQLRVLGYVD